MFGGTSPMLRRRRTLQGGTGQALTYGGTPNAPAQGITQQYLGGNPIGGGGLTGGTNRQFEPWIGGGFGALTGGGGGGFTPKPPFMPTRGPVPGGRPPGGKGGGGGAGPGGGQGGGTGGGHGQGWGARYHELLRRLG